MYIGAQASGGFTAAKRGAHAFGGPAAITYAGYTNSDIENGRIRKDAPPAQLYDLEADLKQTRNLYNEYPEVVKELAALLETYNPPKRTPGQKQGKNTPRKTRIRAGAKANAAPRIPATSSTKSASFDFESGKLEPWKVVDGELGHIVGSRDKFFHNQGEYNKQGEYYLTTLEATATFRRPWMKQQLGRLAVVITMAATTATEAKMKTIAVSHSELKGVGVEKGVMRRDPSDVIKVGELYYVWYSKGKIGPGYDATVWYATSTDAYDWTEKGMALAKGEPGTWEAGSVFTPNILVAEGKYWLFYSGVSKPYKRPYNPDSRIGIAVSDSPDGPWERLATNPALKNSDDPKDFDSHLVDDACLVVREGKYWFYYKGRQLGKSPAQTKMGLAIADHPQGPYVKHEANPVIPGNHEVLVWLQGTGVAAMIGTTGPRHLTNTIQYAEDGVRFTKTHDVKNGPRAGGGYRPEAFTQSGTGDIPNWGVEIGRTKGQLPFIQRFELTEGRPADSKSPNAEQQPALPVRQSLGKGGSATGVNSSKRARPNFVVIFTDDQGYADLGCFGSPSIKTPRLDQMAREGMRVTNFYAQTVCGPSRGALMTGCYPLRFARQDDPNSIHPKLHPHEITIAEVLKKQGYSTGAFGKWDLAGHNPARYKPELLPPHQGFDVYFGTPGSNDRYVKLIRGTKEIEQKTDMSTLTKRYTDEAISFIEKSKEGPFFAYLAHTMPHTKLAASAEFKGKSAGGLYGDVIEELDFNVGRVLDTVKELGLDDNTYVIFTSDNGPWLIRKQHGGHANPLRSGKTSCWEGGLRVPCIMRAPGRIPAGTECEAVTATIDVMPTLAKLAGTSAPTDRLIDGVDISALMHGKSGALNRSFFYYQHNCLRAVRSGKWKLMLPHTEPVRTSIATKWKNHIAPEDAIRIQKAMLFDLDADIGETTDVADKHPEKVGELMKLAQQARNDIGDHNRFGANARTFGAQRRALSSEAKAVPAKTKRRGRKKGR